MGLPNDPAPFAGMSKQAILKNGGTLVTWRDDRIDSEHASQIFRASYIPAKRWNGYAMPLFSRSEALRIMATCNAMEDSEAFSYDSEADMFSYVDADGQTWPVRYVEHGTKRFHEMGDGYTWQEIYAPRPEEWDPEDFATEWSAYETLCAAVAEAMGPLETEAP